MGNSKSARKSRRKAEGRVQAQGAVQAHTEEPPADSSVKGGGARTTTFYSTRGVRLDYLLSLPSNNQILKNGAKLTLPAKRCTSEDLVAAVVRPNNFSGKYTFVELIPDEFVSPRDYECVFVSHAWAYVFEDVLEALTRSSFARDPKKCFVWMDLFSVKQPPDLTDPSWFSEGLHALISKCAGRAVVFDSWRNPRPFRRSWCVWEIYGAVLSTKKLEIIMAQTEELEFLNAIGEDFSTVSKTYAELDARNAQAFSEDDRKMIHDAVESTVGFDSVNESLVAQLRSWIATRGSARVDVSLLAGTREWVFDGLKTFLASDSAVFHLRARGGMGKSVVMKEFVKRYASDIKASHYFKSDDSYSTSARTAIRSVASQLSGTVDGFKLNEVSPGGSISATLSDAIFRPLRSAAASGVIVFDALDECAEAVDLAHAIDSMPWPAGIRVVVSSRPEITMDAAVTLEMSADDPRNVKDLTVFFESECASTEVADEVRARSEGSFLYARLVQPDLAAWRVVSDVSAPVGLDALYDVLFAEIDAELGPERMELALVLAARTALPIETFKECVPNNDFSKAFTALSRVLSFSCDDVRVVHKTVEERLSSLDLSNAHRVLADHCLAEYDRVVESLPSSGNYPSLRLEKIFAVDHVVHHLLNSSRAEKAASVYGSIQRAILAVHTMRGGDAAQIFRDGMNFPRGSPAKLVHDILRLDAKNPCLKEDARTLVTCMESRLVNREQTPAMKHLATEIEKLHRYSDIYRCTSSGEISPGGPFLTNLEGHTDRINSLEWPTDDVIVTGSSDNSAKLWTASSGLEIRTLNSDGYYQGDEKHLIAAASTDLRYVATGYPARNESACCTLWNARSGEMVRKFQYGEIKVRELTDIRFSPDSRRLMTCCYCANTLWDVESGQALHTFDIGTSVAFFPDRPLVALGNTRMVVRGTKRRVVQVWSLDTFKEVSALRWDGGVLTDSLTISPDGKFLVTTRHEKADMRYYREAKYWASVYRLENYSLIKTFEGAQGICFSPDGARAIVYGTKLRLFSTTDDFEKEIKSFGTEIFGTAGYCRCVFSPTGRIIASLKGRDKTVQLWDLEADDAVEPAPPGHLGELLMVSFSPDASVFFACWRHITSEVRRRTAGVFDVQSGAEIAKFNLSGYTFVRALFSRDNKFLAAIAEQGMIVIDVENSSIVKLAKEGMPVGTSIPMVWNVLSGDEKAPLKHEEMISMAFSPDGQKILTGYTDCTAKLWHGGYCFDEQTRFEGHEKKVSAVSFSNDGSRVVTASWDNTVRIWSIDGEELRRFWMAKRDFLSFMPVAVAFSANDASLAYVRIGNGRRAYGVSWDVESTWDIDVESPKGRYFGKNSAFGNTADLCDEFPDLEYRVNDLRKIDRPKRIPRQAFFYKSGDVVCCVGGSNALTIFVRKAVE